MVVFLSDWVGRIPMAALVAVMIMVSIGTFSWDSVRNLRTVPLSANLVMIVTVVVVVFTHNLAVGVLAGVLVAALLFANKVGHCLSISSTLDKTGDHRTYKVTGQVFFSSADKFMAAFECEEALRNVSIDVSGASFADITAASALDRVVIRFGRECAYVTVLGLTEALRTIVDRFGVHDKPEANESLMGRSAMKKGQ